MNALTLAANFLATLPAPAVRALVVTAARASVPATDACDIERARAMARRDLLSIRSITL